MKSSLCKVLHPVAGLPMLSYVLEAARAAAVRTTVVVVGHQAEQVKKAFPDPEIEFVIQEPQLGTGHAVMSAASALEGFDGDALILCGDTPLIRAQTLKDFMDFHQARSGRLTVASTFPDNPFGYGRIIRDSDGRVERIVEQRDATPGELAVGEVNTGIYAVDRELLFSLLAKIGSANAQNEYYLTDIVTEANRDNIPVEGWVIEDAREVIGVNDRVQLAEVSRIVWDMRRTELMLAGVTLVDPGSVFVDRGIDIGEDTVIHQSVTIAGRTAIGRECVIEQGVVIKDSTIRDRVKILQGSRIDSAVIDSGTSIGPMAHLRPDARIGKNARIGNFVEVKKSSVGDGSKASHLTYLGDSTIGADVNIGCGTITCNYDGQAKHATVIGDRCFVGSDVQFIAPVEIGEDSLIGAGSTITQDVPPGTLAVARARQRNIRRKGKSRKTDEDEDRGS